MKSGRQIHSERFLRGLRVWVLCAGLVWMAVANAEREYSTTLSSADSLVSGATEPTQSPETVARQALAQDPPDWERAREYFSRAAEAGSSTAMGYLGWIYEEGLGVEVNPGQAVKWYARAARAGALQYAQKLGWMYLAGQGVEANRGEAESWFAFAIAQEYTPARIAWASVLIADAQGGRGAVDLLEAREHLMVALDSGEALASYFLARLYLEGIGNHPRDTQLGAEYVRLGAHSGHAQMQGWLAFLYWKGEGVEQDWIEAARWANLAAAGGDSLGNDLRQYLERERLSPEEREEARRRAVEWALQWR